MEKGNGRLIAIVALVIAVVGLSVGFAAFSSTLNIASNATATIGTNVWNVGFADTTGNMADTQTPTSINGTTNSANNGTLSMYKYTLQQGTAATISTDATANNSSVTYNFKIKNAGQVTASLNSITAGGITCAYPANGAGSNIEGDAVHQVGAQGTAGSGTITDADCRAMFSATLTIDGTDYDITSGTVSPSTYSSTIAAGASINASLTIAAKANANPTTAPNGDFTVTLANTTVVYGS